MALTRCAALEAAEFGVRINAVAPSLMHPFLSKVMDQGELVRRSPKPSGAPRRLGGRQRHRLSSL